MKLLIIGGTRFLGRHIIDVALIRGHHVTMFNRGQTNPELYPKVERIRGDRDGGLDALKGNNWDVVIDTCGYVPRIVRASAEMLSGAVEHYTFISTISVYQDLESKGMDESAPLGVLEDETLEEITEDTYGPLKVLCEQAVQETCPDKTLIVRPGLIVGPHDTTDRFTYWPARLARGGEVLAPGNPDQQTQIIDVRDLAEWTLVMAEKRQTGVYNATGPESKLTMSEMIDTCHRAVGSTADITWVNDEFLVKNEIVPFVDIPLWLTAGESNIMAVSVAKAVAAGLTFRPLEDTVVDTLAWDQTRPVDMPRHFGISAQREAELLKAWRES
jgi:2'-hydroxyisoflavone reductase